MKKIFKIALTSLPIGGIVAGAGTFLAISLKSKKTQELAIQGSNINNQITKTEGSYEMNDKLNVFPELDPHSFYSYIRMAENKPIINNDMIAYIASYILKNSMITDGDISWGYYQPNESEVYIKASWKPAYNIQNTPYTQTYHFTLQKNV